MKFLNLTFLLLFFSAAVFADEKAVMENTKTVIANIETYWDARNSKDWDTVIALSSSHGMLNSNSDGSFHKPLAIQTAADWEKQTPGAAGTITVHAAEAHQINDGAVFARYYAEGVVPDGSGGFKPYRTRVTSLWVLEGKKLGCKNHAFFICKLWRSSPNHSG
jgi:hypothetical protein